MTILTDLADAADAIDPLFPVAGQDNNSQGFRDNFSNTQIGLEKTVTLITDLQTNTAKKNVDNNFNGVAIVNAETNQLYGTVSTGNVNGENASYLEAEYFSFVFSGSSTIQFSNCPISDRYAKITVDVRPGTTSNHTVNFSTTSGSIIKPAGLTLPFSLGTDTTVRHIFEAWTINGGNTVFVSYKGAFL